MKHPKLHLIHAVCATCRTAHTFRSVARSLRIDVCSGCHPAYTGVQRTVEGGSRVDRFNRRRALAA